MRKNEHVSARVLTAIGPRRGLRLPRSGAFAYSLDGVAALAGAAVARWSKIVGFLGAAVLVWALWPMPVGRPLHGRPDVRVTAIAGRWTRWCGCATSASTRCAPRCWRCATCRRVEDVVLVDHSGRPEVASLATEFQAVYAATDPDDHNGLRVMAAAVRTPEFLLFDAGDVPAHDIVRRLAGDFADDARRRRAGTGRVAGRRLPGARPQPPSRTALRAQLAEPVARPSARGGVARARVRWCAPTPCARCRW